MADHVGMLKTLVVGMTNDLIARLALEGDVDGNTALHLALRNERLRRKGKMKVMVRYLIDVGPGAAYRVNKNGVSPLYLAVLWGYEDVVKYMFKVMPIDSVPDSVREGLIEAKKVSIAHAAINIMNMGMVQVIMENLPGLINSSNGKGWKPLSYAAYEGHLDKVSYLLNKFPDSVKNFDADGSLPVHKAVGGGHVSVVKEFISCCPQTLYDVDKKGRSILHIAVRYIQADILSYLRKEAGVEKLFKLRDHEGKTFVDLAKELKC